MKKNMLVHLRISSENMVLYMLETVSCIFDVLFDCLTDMSFIIDNVLYDVETHIYMQVYSQYTVVKYLNALIPC